MKKSQLRQIIKEEVQNMLTEALKFPPGKYDDQYKKLITATQKQPKWDSKPYVNRTTATHDTSGNIAGKPVAFLWNVPGHFGANYTFRGLMHGYSKEIFNKSGDKIDEFLAGEHQRIAKEKGLSTRVPMVWLLAAKNIPDELIKANIKEFADAIKSVS
jgi:hypothetical protein